MLMMVMVKLEGLRCEIFYFNRFGVAWCQRIYQHCAHLGPLLTFPKFPSRRPNAPSATIPSPQTAPNKTITIANMNGVSIDMNALKKGEVK